MLYSICPSTNPSTFPNGVCLKAQDGTGYSSQPVLAGIIALSRGAPLIKEEKMIKTTKKQISKNRVKISVEIAPEMMVKLYDEVYERLAPTVTLPGFRAGKAPKIMTVEAIGQQRLIQDALSRGVDEGYRASLLEHKLYPVTQPAISIANYPAFGDEQDKNKLTFDIEFDILPEAKVGDYKKIKLPKVDPKMTEVKDEEVEKVLGYLGKQSAELTDKEGKAEKGDWIQVSFEGSVKGVVKENMTSKSFPMVLGETQLVPGFEEQIVGMKKGEERSFDIKMPKDMPDKEIAGQDVKFKVNLEELKSVKMPKVDDAFALKFGHKNPKLLKEAIKKSLVGEKEERQNAERIAAISDHLIKITKVDVPDSLIEEEGKRIRETFEHDLQHQQQTIEQYLAQTKTDPKKFESDLKEGAKRNILLSVAINEVAKKEGVKIGENGTMRPVFDYLIKLNS